LLEFHTGTGTELAVSQAQTVVEQARANYSAELRGRAQAENALVLLLGESLPAESPASRSAEFADDSGRHPGGAAVRPAGAPPGCPAG